MLSYIAHRRRKTSRPNALDTLVLSEQESFQWTSERLVTTRRITEVSWQRIPSRRSSDSKGPTTKWAELVNNTAQEVGDDWQSVVAVYWRLCDGTY